jgi:predicted RNA binding protein YcfA (HicA-like mRNA interferase family)
MPRIPKISGNDALRAFRKAGFEVDRIRGSHHILKKDGHALHLSVPVHGAQIVGTGTLKSLIENAGLTVERFIELLG